MRTGHPVRNEAARALWPASTLLRAVLVVLCAVAVTVVVAARAGDGTAPAAAPAAAQDQVPTSFGALAIGAVTWSRGGDVGPVHQHGDPAAGGGHAGHAKPAASTVVLRQHQVWSNQVRVGVTVENHSDHPVLFSPGQLRLSLAGSGATVAPLDAGSAPGPVPPGASVRTWVSFRAPEATDDLLLEFDDVDARPPLLVPLDTVHGPTRGGHDHE